MCCFGFTIHSKKVEAQELSKLRKEAIQMKAHTSKLKSVAFVMKAFLD